MGAWASVEWAPRSPDWLAVQGAAPASGDVQAPWAPMMKAGGDAVVVELYANHAEVLPSSLALAHALGMRKATVVVASTNPLYGMPTMCSEWNIKPRWLHVHTTDRRISSAVENATLVIYQSPEYFGVDNAMPASLLPYLPRNNE